MAADWLNPYHLQVASFVLINTLLGVSIYVTLATGQLSLGNAGFMSIGAYTTAILTTKPGVPTPAGTVVGAAPPPGGGGGGAQGAPARARHAGARHDPRRHRESVPRRQDGRRVRADAHEPGVA